MSYTSGSKLYRDEIDDCIRAKYRTECWLEHSVFHERISEPDENISFTLLRITTPVPGMSPSNTLYSLIDHLRMGIDSEKIKLSLSSLDQSELCWIDVSLGRSVRSPLIFSIPSNGHHHARTQG